MKKLIFIIAVIAIIAGGVYWYLMISTPADIIVTGDDVTPSGFIPFNRPSTNTGGTNVGTSTGSGDNTATTSSTAEPVPIPVLRLLSNTPVGGYGASSTKDTTNVRWVDRGRGNIYESDQNTLDIKTLSNTILPRVYESIWDKNLNAFLGTLLNEDGKTTTTVYAEIVKRMDTETSATNTQNISAPAPFELKGRDLPDGIIDIVLSPNKDRIFMLVLEGNQSAGYTSTITGGNLTKIFTTPLTQITASWPETNTIAITTNGSGAQNGYLYFVNPQNGVWKKILGPLPGLNAKINKNATYAVISVTGNNRNVLTSIYNIKEGQGTDAVIRTLADKCTWGNDNTIMLYCAVPTQPFPALYPDDWYTGAVSLVDKIWQVNAETGEIKLLSSIVDTSDRVIDAFNLGLDDKDKYLIFMNKNDLSLWSLNVGE